MKVKADDIHDMLDWPKTKEFFRKYGAGKLELEIKKDTRSIFIKWHFIDASREVK